MADRLHRNFTKTKGFFQRPNIGSRVVLIGLFTVVAGLASLLAEESHLEGVSLLALAPLSGQAVVQLSTGSLRRVQSGDALAELQASVLEVLDDRLVLDVQGEPCAPEAPCKAWLYRANSAGESSRIQYLNRKPPPQQPLRKPRWSRGDILLSTDAPAGP